MDQATVLKVAKLARLKISEDKIPLYTKELTRIVDLLEELHEVDTKNVEPLVNVNEHTQRLRKDEVDDGNCAESVLKNAPKEKFGYFTVPKVIE